MRPEASLLAASLVMYRVAYYIIPLVLAIAIAAWIDIRRKRVTPGSGHIAPSSLFHDKAHAG